MKIHNYLILLNVLLFTLPANLFAGTYIDELFSLGYPQAVQQYKNRITQRLDHQDINTKYSELTMIVRDATAINDFETIDWITDNISKNNLLEVPQGMEINLHWLIYVAQLSDTRINLETKENIFWSFNDKILAELLDEEFVFVCNEKLDYLIENDKFATAKSILIACAGRIALFNNLSINSSLSFISRAMLLRERLSLTNGKDILFKAMNPLITSENFIRNIPNGIQTLRILSETSIYAPFPDAQNYLIVANEIKRSGQYIPDNYLADIRAAYAINSMIYGYPQIDTTTAAESSFSGLLNKYQFIDRYIRDGDLRDPSNNENTSDEIARLRDFLYQDESSSEILEFLENIRQQYLEKRRAEILYFSDIGSDKSIEEKALLGVLASHLSNIGYQTNDTSSWNAIYGVFLRDDSTQDLGYRLLSNEYLQKYNLNEVSLSYLQLAKQIDIKLLNALVVISDKSLEYRERGYAYKQADDVSKDENGIEQFKFLKEYNLFFDMMKQFWSVSNGQYLDAIAFQTPNIASIRSSIDNQTAVVAYRRYGNFVFKCVISTSEYYCNSNPIQFNFEEAVYKLRDSIIHNTTEQNVNYSNQIYNAIFSGLDLAEYQNILINPPKSDYAVPYNLLETDDGSFLGLSAILSIVPSLFVVPNKSIERFDEGYLAFADPNFRVFQTADANQDFSDIFKLRGASYSSALNDLSQLPDTRFEVERIIASRGNSKASNVFLGASATELSYRSSQLDKFGIIHFATHGLVSNELSGVAEPALALSVAPDAKSTLNDGLLTESEISSIPLSGQLVILSACQTATDFGSVVNSGYDGLSSAFLNAGAGSVLGTQWSVGSRSTAIYISNLVNSLDVNNRLEVNDLKEIIRISNLTPFEWGGFINFTQLTQKRVQNILEPELEFEISSTAGSVNQILDMMVTDKGMLIIKNEYLDQEKVNSKIILKTIDNVTELDLGEIRPIRFIHQIDNEIIVQGILFDKGNPVPTLTRYNLDAGEISKNVSFASELDEEGIFNSINKIFVQPDGFSIVIRPFEKVDKSENSPELPNDALNDQLHKLTIQLEVSEISILEDAFSGDKISRDYYEGETGSLYAIDQTITGNTTGQYFQMTGYFSCQDYFGFRIQKLDRNFQVLDQSNQQYASPIEHSGKFMNGFVSDSCGRISRLLENEFEISEPLNVILGDPYVETIRLNDDLIFHIGSISYPASFFINLLEERSVDLNWLYDQSSFFKPQLQFMEFHLLEAEEGIANLNLRHHRHFSSAESVKIYDNRVYFITNENKTSSRIFSYDISDLTNFAEGYLK